MAKVLISAGHTQADPGDVFGELKEADLTRKIAAKVATKLEDIGLEVTKVPLDLPLPERIEWINNTGAALANGDICLEIHINSGGKTGLEGWFRGEGKNESQEFINTVLESVSKDTGYPSLGAKSEHDHELGSLSFLNRTNPITAILETLFIDNEADIAILKSDPKLDDLAKAIAKGINKYLHSGKTKKPAPMPSFTPPTPKPSMPAPTFPSAGGFGTTPSSFGGLGGPAPTGGAFGADREQRKEMIKKRYIQILGREPNQNDTNYFLNAGTTEDQLIKRMIESQEHVDLVKSKQELAKAKEELEKVNSELIQYKSKANEKDLMVQNLQQAVDVKKKQLDQIVKKMQEQGISPDRYLTA